MRVRATATAATGIVLLAAGAAVAGPWWADAGLGVESVTATAVAVFGIVLLGAGAAVLVRSFRGWRRVPVVAALAVVTVVGSFLIAVPVAATTVPPDDTTAIPEAAGSTTVRFTATDGIELSGSFLPAAGTGTAPPGAALVVVPGAGSTRAGAWDQAVALRDEGFGVLVIDPRGHGTSDGNAMDLGWYGDEDVVGAVDWLTAQAGVDPDRIGAVGLSMGGEMVIGAAATDPRIRAVVAEGATARGADDKWWLPDEYGVAGRVQLVLDRAMYGLMDLMVDRGPPTPLREAVRAAAPRPVLVVAAREVDDEVAVAERLEGAAHGNVDVWIVEDGGHVAGYGTDPATWTERVGGFLSGALR